MERNELNRLLFGCTNGISKLENKLSDPSLKEYKREEFKETIVELAELRNFFLVIEKKQEELSIKLNLATQNRINNLKKACEQLSKAIPKCKNLSKLSELFKQFHNTKKHLEEIKGKK